MIFAVSKAKLNGVIMLSLILPAGMGRHREAALVLEEGSKMDPLNAQMRLQLEAATQGILKDLLEGT